VADYLPQTYEIPACVSGDTFPGLRISSVTINGAAPTTALASVRVDFRTAPDAAAAALSLNSSSSGITINNNATWDFELDAFTITLDADCYFYDIETTDSGGTVRTYLRGSWTVAQDTTR